MAWTPMPAALFALDQLAHGIVIAIVWAIWLANAAPLPGVENAVRTIMNGADPATFHRVVLTTVILVDLAIINIRGGMLFVATLVRPREVVIGETPAPAEAPAEPEEAVAAADERSGGFTVRIGPFVARAESTTAPAAARVAPSSMPASAARVGATIGVLERLLILAFVLTNAPAAIGLVIAAKTLARFKQLDDRQFAEYYLLGTLASVSVAVGSGLVAVAALA
jgi:hypothetical protein